MRVRGDCQNTPYDDIHTIVLLVDVDRSISRRTAYACDPRFALWFDPDFLTAYRDFLTRLDTWITPHPELISIETDDDLDWPRLAALLPATLGATLRAVLARKSG